MTTCTACKKTEATIHVLDLQDGAIVEQKHLCSGCAEQTGMVAPKPGAAPLKISQSEMLDLMGKLEIGQQEKRGSTACPACGLTTAEFKVRGRMGCARCYDAFKDALLPLLERVHDATSHRGRFPKEAGEVTEVALSTEREGAGEPPPSAPELAALHRKLATAVDAENYEEAARLRDQIQALEEGKA